MKNKGFSLIELLVSITISSILLILLLFAFNKIIKIGNKLEEINTLRISNRTIFSVLNKILYNTGCYSYIDNGILFEENSIKNNPLRYNKDTLIIYKTTLNTKGLKETIDSIKLYKDDSLLVITKNNKKYNLDLKIKDISYEFGVRKDDTIKLSSDKWLANGQISKNLNEYQFNNNSKGEIYYNDYFSIPETSTIIVSLTTSFIKNFPEGLDTFVCLIMNNNDTLAKEYFKPNGYIQNLKFICSPGTKAKIKFKCKAHKGLLKIIDVCIIKKGKLYWTTNPVDIKLSKAIKINISPINKDHSITTISEIFELPNMDL